MRRQDAVGAQALAHRGEQHALQVAAVDRELRRVVARPAAGRLGIDELAEPVEERRLARDDREPLQVVEHAERAQLGGGMRQDVDADAERQDLAARLVDPTGDARGVQAERQRQAADAGADDEDFVAAHGRGRVQGGVAVCWNSTFRQRPARRT